MSEVTGPSYSYFLEHIQSEILPKASNDEMRGKIIVRFCDLNTARRVNANSILLDK